MTEALHVARTLRVLELLAYAPMSAPQLAEALHAHPRTVRRTLARLVEDEYVVYNTDRRYSSTMRLVALAGQVLGNSTLVGRARPYLVLAQERTGAVAELVVPSYGSVLCVLRAGADGEIAGPAVQEIVPAHASAGGKVLLAARPRWRESVLARPLEEHAEHTITDPTILRRELTNVLASGYGTEPDEFRPEVTMIAAPISTGSETVAALQVSGPEIGDYVTRLLMRTAREFSDDLQAMP
jgi:DNA-binding IclR family transcriptional regulator